MAIGNHEHGGEIARLSLSVYLELMTVLGAYREALVLVGGWAPCFILERFGRGGTDFQHIGSVDIDIAVDPRLVSPDEYASIVERLERQGYRQRLNKLGQPIPFIFEREVELGEGRGTHVIEIDFLAPEYGGTGKRQRHQRIQPDLLARKARGCDLSIRSVGPAGVGHFLASDSVERDRLIADAFMNISEFIKALEE